MRDGKIEKRVVFTIRGEKNEVLHRRFELKEALALCKRNKLIPSQACTDELVEVIWINGEARILGPAVV